VWGDNQCHCYSHLTLQISHNESSWNLKIIIQHVWICQQFMFSKKENLNHMNKYKIFWFYWIDIWINYNIMSLFTSFEQFFIFFFVKFEISWYFHSQQHKTKCYTCFIIKRLHSLVAKALGCFHDILGSNLGKSCIWIWYTWWCIMYMYIVNLWS